MMTNPQSGDLSEKQIRKFLFLLIGTTLLIRLFVAATLELSVDEVYYWTYAIYPDWSHFDHPPMVGLVIQLFSLNLLFDSELALRLGAVIISVANTLLIYRIGKLLKNPITGLYAATLFNASVYCSVLAGNFIIPDTPQLLFWLLSLFFLLRSLPVMEKDSSSARDMVLAGLFIGLGIFSKYHAVFIWAGAGLYILIYNRAWLLRPSLYLSVAVSLCFVAPIVYWNVQNDWISFTFHGERVANKLVVRWDYFFTEVGGQIAYNNPVNYFLIVLGIITILKRQFFLSKDYIRILVLNGLPLWLVFTSFSLFRSTLPHWTAPTFTPLILIAAAFLADKFDKKEPARGSRLFPGILRSSLILLYVFMAMAWLLINYYPGTIGRKDPIAKYGDTDFTLDMFGWNQISDGFKMIRERDLAMGHISPNAPIISPKYFPGTQIDYYVARPTGMKVLQYGALPEIHKYAWINHARGHLQAGEDAYMISTSNWYQDPYLRYSSNFEQIIPADTINVMRSGKLAYYAFVFHLKNYQGNFHDPLTTILQ